MRQIQLELRACKDKIAEIPQDFFNINGHVIPTVKHPKVLGVTFDSLYMFSKHTECIVKKVEARNRILKALTDSTWKKDKETILAAYKVIGRPVLDCAVPVWFPTICDTQRTELQ